MFNASIANLVPRVRLIAQPTKALEYASRTAAKYSQPSRVGQDLRFAHQLGHRVATARYLLGQQLDVHSRSAVRLAAGLVDRPDTSREFNPALLAVTGTALPRSVVATARDLQRLAQRRHTVLPSIVLDEGVLHFASRAK